MNFLPSKCTPSNCSSTYMLPLGPNPELVVRTPPRSTPLPRGCHRLSRVQFVRTAVVQKQVHITDVLAVIQSTSGRQLSCGCFGQLCRQRSPVVLRALDTLSTSLPSRLPIALVLWHHAWVVAHATCSGTTMPTMDSRAADSRPMQAPAPTHSSFCLAVTSLLGWTLDRMMGTLRCWRASVVTRAGAHHVHDALPCGSDSCVPHAPPLSPKSGP
jgi:hypothetical protein